MRMITRLAGGAAATAVVLALAPVPASAGGPTSVLLVSPSRGVATALYHSDSGYDTLLKLVGENPAADPAAPAGARGVPGTDAIVLTWMIHDVQPWRVDRVYVTAEGGPWIQTTTSMNGASLWDEQGVVHRTSDPNGLIALLQTMRLTGPADDSNRGVLAPQFQPSPQPASTPVTQAATEKEAAPIGWLWLVIGAAAGAALVVGFRPLVRRVRRN